MLIYEHYPNTSCYTIGLQEAVTRDPHNILEPTESVARSLTGSYLRFFQELLQRSRDQRLPLYLVGGAIRDALLGYPITDLDFAVAGDARDLASDLANEMGAEVVTHNRFHTATLVLNDVRVDLASARTEKYPRPGELPIVELGPMLEDLQRRDFTINALALPLWEDNPSVMDISNGLADLATGTIKILHKDSFTDDPTRLFRAVRYEQRFGFTMDSSTEELFSSVVQDHSIDLLSADRIRHEFERIFHETKPYLVLQRLCDLGVLTSVMGCLKFGNPVAVEERTNILDSLQQKSTFGPLVSISCNLSDNDRASFIKKLNMPRDWSKVVNDVGLIESRSDNLTKSNITNSEIFILLENIGDDAILGYLEITESDTLWGVLLRYISRIKDTQTMLNGSDLRDMGLDNGPDIGYILRVLLLKRLDGEIASEHDERSFVEFWMRQVSPHDE